MNCVFCRIISGELPGMMVYEDEHSCVFMDIAGDVDGHMLALPKKHVESILDCDNEALGYLMSAVKTVSNHVVGNCGYDGVNILSASGKSAGQSVGHFHIHIIPRRNGDGVDAWPQLPGNGEPVEKIYKKIKMI